MSCTIDVRSRFPAPSPGKSLRRMSSTKRIYQITQNMDESEIVDPAAACNPIKTAHPKGDRTGLRVTAGGKEKHNAATATTPPHRTFRALVASRSPAAHTMRDQAFPKKNARCLRAVRRTTSWRHRPFCTLWAAVARQTPIARARAVLREARRMPRRIRAP